MPQPLAYVDGRLIPAAEAAIRVTDAGFVLGTTVAEQLRTFRGELFQLRPHFERLMRSLAIVGLELPFEESALLESAEELARYNHSLVDPDDDIGLCIFVTPGPYATYHPMASPRPFVGMHTYLQPFNLWQEKYVSGESLIVSKVTQVPDSCWPAELKCRSRMHYYLADREARQTDPQARALLLDTDGLVSESSTASVVIYTERDGLLVPPSEKILPGISLGVLHELAEAQGIPYGHRELTVANVSSADEVFLCSTSPCLLPVCQLDGHPIGNGVPGSIFERMIATWSDRVGVDIPGQARRFADRRNGA